MKEYSSQHISKVKSLARPRILLNVCTHGNERVGLKVAAEAKKLKLHRGSIVVHVANKRALAMRKRYVESDLNRSFPGSKNGTYEERLAYRMSPFIHEFDFVIDVHSTQSGYSSTIIVIKDFKKLQPVIRAARPKRAMYMPSKKSRALLSMARQGIAFEYGKDNDADALLEMNTALRNILHHFKMLDSVESKYHQTASHQTRAYESVGPLKKPDGYEPVSSIRNFVKVKKGAIVAKNKETGALLRASMDFYPFLFGENSYTTMFGFMTKRKDLL